MKPAMKAALALSSAFFGADAVGGSSFLLRSARLHAGDADFGFAALGAGSHDSFRRENTSDLSLMETDAVAEKPIRIARSGQGMHRRRRTTHHGVPVHLKCGQTSKVTSTSNKDDECPEDCPYFAQDHTDEDFCTFSCVAEPQCAQMYSKTPIGDADLGVCRSCMVDGCKECDHSVTEDQCKTCQAGYVLKDGMCNFKYAGDWMYVVGGILAALVLFVVIWITDMAIRPACNSEVLEQSLAVREQQKLRMKKDETGTRPLFPLTTNLLKTQVAGPGMMLHFNFQLAVVLWAVFVAIVWICLATFIDDALWILGTRKFGTPRENCILVAWGYETQQRLMWTKVLFLYITYIGSFLMCMAYGVYQLREFQEADFQHKTMKDFAAMVVGLPNVEGSKNVEDDLKAKIESLGGRSIVGVSVAWDYQKHEKLITDALDADLDDRVVAKVGSPDPAPLPEMNPVRKAFYTLEKKVFRLESGNEGESDDGVANKEEELVELLNGIKTSQRAFVVFETQKARDEAVEKAAGGFEYEGQGGIVLWTLDAEPNTVQWVNYGHSTALEKMLKLIAGFGFIALACLFWAVIFYAPYAYYVMTFNYENGREPGAILSISFSMIVVAGNAIMYEVCAQVSDWVGFRFKDNREACYMMLYTVACLFNVLLDFVTTYFTAEKVMEGLGFRNYFGVPLEDITDFTTKFETYGMQRSLAENTYAYAFPSTFLIPFLIEPMPTIVAPLVLGKWIVRTHPEVLGRDAEEWVAMVPIEMGRYADILLNTILGILIFYFPGGYTWMLFLGLAGSHLWIYLFDHCRVLRSIPACTFATYDVEWWAQALMAPIIGIMAACLVFKTNCEPGYHCIRGPTLILSCSAAWLVHTIFHLLCLVYVVPKFGKPEPEEDPAAGETFSSLCHHVPCSWFTANPVHCLRSKLKFKHSPPCSFYYPGKEKFQKTNTAIGCFYEEGEAKSVKNV